MSWSLADAVGHLGGTSRQGRQGVEGCGSAAAVPELRDDRRTRNLGRRRPSRTMRADERAD